MGVGGISRRQRQKRSDENRATDLSQSVRCPASRIRLRRGLVSSVESHARLTVASIFPRVKPLQREE